MRVCRILEDERLPPTPQDYYHQMIELSSEARRAYEEMLASAECAVLDLSEERGAAAEPDSPEPGYGTSLGGRCAVLLAAVRFSQQRSRKNIGLHKIKPKRGSVLEKRQVKDIQLRRKRASFLSIHTSTLGFVFNVAVGILPLGRRPAEDCRRLDDTLLFFKSN